MAGPSLTSPPQVDLALMPYPSLALDPWKKTSETYLLINIMNAASDVSLK